MSSESSIEVYLVNLQRVLDTFTAYIPGALKNGIQRAIEETQRLVAIVRVTSNDRSDAILGFATSEVANLIQKLEFIPVEEDHGEIKIKIFSAQNTMRRVNEELEDITQET